MPSNNKLLSLCPFPTLDTNKRRIEINFSSKETIIRPQPNSFPSWMKDKKERGKKEEAIATSALRLLSVLPPKRHQFLRLLKLSNDKKTQTTERKVGHQSCIYLDTKAREERGTKVDEWSNKSSEDRRSLSFSTNLLCQKLKRAWRGWPGVGSTK